MFAATSTNPGMHVPWASKRARLGKEGKGSSKGRRPHSGLHLLFARVTAPLFHSSKASRPSDSPGPLGGLGALGRLLTTIQMRGPWSGQGQASSKCVRGRALTAQL